MVAIKTDQPGAVRLKLIVEDVVHLNCKRQLNV
jgi:hypothetical protein